MPRMNCAELETTTGVFETNEAVAKGMRDSF